LITVWPYRRGPRADRDGRDDSTAFTVDGVVDGIVAELVRRHLRLFAD
jgi:hypothetical protein